MFRLLSYLIWFALTLGVAEVVVNVLLEMAGKAAHVHQHNQIKSNIQNGTKCFGKQS
jgi:hypothetical protein